MLNRYRTAVVSDFDQFRTTAVHVVPELRVLAPVASGPFRGAIASVPLGSDPDAVVLAAAFSQPGLYAEAEPAEAVRLIVPTSASLQLTCGSTTRAILPTGVCAFMPSSGLRSATSAGHFLEVGMGRQRLARVMRQLDSERDLGPLLDQMFFDQRLPGLADLSSHLRQLVADLDADPAAIVDLAAFRQAHEQLLLLRIAHVLAGATASERGRAVDRNRAALTRAVDFIVSHADDPIEFSAMAEYAGLSIRSLQILFRREFDCTIVQFIQRRRLTNVRERIERGDCDLTIAAIARASGFHHLSEFSRSYKALYGELPRETQQRARRHSVAGRAARDPLRDTEA